MFSLVIEKKGKKEACVTWSFELLVMQLPALVPHLTHVSSLTPLAQFQVHVAELQQVESCCKVCVYLGLSPSLEVPGCILT